MPLYSLTTIGPGAPSTLHTSDDISIKHTWLWIQLIINSETWSGCVRWERRPKCALLKRESQGYKPLSLLQPSTTFLCSVFTTNVSEWAVYLLKNIVIDPKQDMNRGHGPHTVIFEHSPCSFTTSTIIRRRMSLARPHYMRENEIQYLAKARFSSIYR